MISQHWWRHQAITWANVDSGLCRHMASLGHNALSTTSRLKHICSSTATMITIINVYPHPIKITLFMCVPCIISVCLHIVVACLRRVMRRSGRKTSSIRALPPPPPPPQQGIWQGNVYNKFHITIPKIIYKHTFNTHSFISQGNAWGYDI